MIEIIEMRDIKGYEGEYAVTKSGLVWSYKRNKFLKLNDNGIGYLYVALCHGGIRQQKYIHRIVAEAFIPNPDNLPEINHKDEDKSNNCVDNLEWITHIDNLNYGTRNKRISSSQLSKNFSK